MGPIGQHDPLTLLKQGQVASCDLVPRGSNYTFLVSLRGEDGARCQAVYKPRQGEAPLWDFPDGTLYKREYAAYLMAQALGWGFIPPTVIREGPYGVGAMQLYVEHDPRCHYFTLRHQYGEEFRRICLFDLIVNNADRKAGHCLLGLDGHIWSIDHGLAFNAAPKLRTVIWDYAGEAIPPPLLACVEALLKELETGGELSTALGDLLMPQEMEALRRRLRHLLSHPVYPLAPAYGGVPWPWL